MSEEVQCWNFTIRGPKPTEYGPENFSGSDIEENGVFKIEHNSSPGYELRVVEGEYAEVAYGGDAGLIIRFPWDRIMNYNVMHNADPEETSDDQPET